MSTPTTELLGTADAARVIGVAKRTLQQWVQDGSVRPTARTTGGHARWDPDELRRQLNELHRTSG